MLDIFKTKTIYVQIKTNQMIFILVDTNKIITLDSKENFGDDRLLISNFSIASELMKNGFKLLINNMLLAPRVIVHPLENINNPLSEVEEKIFQECALNAGAKIAIIHTGNILTANKIQENY